MTIGSNDVGSCRLGVVGKVADTQPRPGSLTDSTTKAAARFGSNGSETLEAEVNGKILQQSSDR